MQVGYEYILVPAKRTHKSVCLFINAYRRFEGRMSRHENLSTETCFANMFLYLNAPSLSCHVQLATNIDGDRKYCGILIDCIKF